MKKISIDCRMINDSGIGTYLKNLVPLIVDLLPTYSFCLLGNKAALTQFDWINKTNIQIVELSSKIYSIGEQVELIKKIPKDSSLFWAPHINIPVLYNKKMLVTVHDVFHLALPQFNEGILKKIYARVIIELIQFKASSIITVSEFTKEELIRLTNFKSSNKIQRIHLGSESLKLNILKDNNDCPPKQYFLVVGNVKPHKNILNMLKAFELIKDEVKHDVIVVGKKEGFITGDPAVLELAEKMNDRVHFTGYVEDKLLKQYYSYAEALIFPSIYEGFGLPPLEAMSADCVVLASSLASMPEVCGDAALYFNPHDINDIASKMITISKNPDLKNELIQKGKQRVKHFSWSTCAYETAKVIREVLNDEDSYHS
jgi:glycosyltransferase involved in cell wall biosynthesis